MYFNFSNTNKNTQSVYSLVIPQSYYFLVVLRISAILWKEKKINRKH